MFGIKEGERLKLYKYTNGTCNASGPAIRALRERAGISQEQLAAKLQLAGLNLNQKAVSRIETGDRVVQTSSWAILRRCSACQFAHCWNMKNEAGNRLFFYAKKRENVGNELDYIHP